MRTQITKRLALSGLLTAAASPALAAGLPQLDPSNFAPQIVWLVISFVILYVLMTKVALPRVTRVLEERQTRIEGNIERAEALRTEAQETAEAYDAAIAAARQAAQAVLSEARDRIAADAAARHAELGERLTGEIAAAEARIGQAKRDALAQMQALAVEIAETAAQRLTGDAPDGKAVTTAVKTVMKERH